MNITNRETVCVVVLLVACFISGCGEPRARGPAASGDLGTTIGSLAEVFALETIQVEGYGLVGGLRGTGSAQCPPQLRAYLERYILRQLPDEKDVKEFISSLTTAVVRLDGSMPAAVLKNQYFDVRVSALPGTQTMSLEGGEVWGAELYEAGRFGIGINPLAHAEGPVFIDTIDSSKADKKTGYVLAGGTVLGEYKISLILGRPDYRIAGRIRDRLNERFGEGTARAVGPDRVELKVPAKYAERKQRFISVVKATYLIQRPEVTRERISTFINKLASLEDQDTSEAALEAIGKASLGKLVSLLGSPGEEVRLRAARCMLNLGSDRGLPALREIAIDKGSAYRVAALEAITATARRNDAAAISRLLLRDEDFDIRLTAYEQLRKLDDIAIRRRFIGRNFYLEQIGQSKHKAVFVARSGQPHIVLFGAPIRCRDNVFVESADGSIMINASAGQKYVSIIRKHPRRPTVVGLLKCSFDLGDIIQTLCAEPLQKSEQERIGLGVSYADAIALLKQMCDKGAVEAEFRAGPLPKID